MRNNILRMLVGTVIAGALLAGVAQPSRSAASCTLTPQLREVAIDQGLAGYPRLVRGKETLVRPFFTLPSCADTTNGANIMVKSATLAVKNGATRLTPASGIATATAPLGPTFPLITTPSGAILPPELHRDFHMAMCRNAAIVRRHGSPLACSAARQQFR